MVNPAQGVSVISAPKQVTVMTAGKTATASNVPMVSNTTEKNKEFREKGLHEDFATYNKAKANYYFNKDLKEGSLAYVPAKKLLGMTLVGSHYEYHAGKKDTLGSVKYRFNLPDGSLKSQAQEYGGDRDKHPAPEVVLIGEADMEKALGKKIFHAAVED